MRIPNFALACAIALLGQGGAAFQTPSLTEEEARDAYEIYSSVLRTEMPNEWKVTGWVIQRETRTFPSSGNGPEAICLQPSAEQAAIYGPLIDDYVKRNRRPVKLENRFDLPLYLLLGDAEIRHIEQERDRRVAEGAHRDTGPLGFPGNAVVIFHVSAVGFNADRTRALVYAGHHCGGLCGGGQYHFLVRKDGKWLRDSDYRGMSCMWAA